MTPAMTPADPLQNQSPFDHVIFQVEFPYPTVLPCISALGIFTNKGYLHAETWGPSIQLIKEQIARAAWSFSPGFSWRKSSHEKIDIQGVEAFHQLEGFFGC